MHFTERHNYTDEQAEEVLRKALIVTERVDPPEDLRGIVLAKAIDLYSANQILAEQVAPAGILANIEHNRR